MYVYSSEISNYKQISMCHVNMYVCMYMCAMSFCIRMTRGPGQMQSTIYMCKNISECGVLCICVQQASAYA